MTFRKLLVISAMTALLCAAAPRSASADWVLTPFLGWNFSGSADVHNNTAGTSFNNQFEHKLDYGLSLANMGAGIFGFEVDFGYSPNFFETGTASNNAFDFTNDSNVTTLTGNVIVGAPIGGHGGSIRPYAVGGVGLIRSNVQDAGKFFDVSSKNDFGLDVGAGVMGFVSQNVGFRGELRYFRGFRGSNDNPTTLGLSDFNFWRGSVGVAFKF
jgi:opacity protein-like surface antigen